MTFFSAAVEEADDVAAGVDRFQAHIEAPQPGHMLEHFLGLGVERAALELGMAQGQRPVVAGTLRLEVEEADGWVPWEEVRTLATSQALDRHYISCTAPALASIDESKRRVAGLPVTELACGHDAMIAAPDQLATALLG